MSDDNVRPGPWSQNAPTGGADQNVPTGGGGVVGGGDGSQLTEMQIRLAKIEATIDTYKLVFTILTAVIFGGFALIGVQVTRIDGRLSAMSTEVATLPDKINANLLVITRTLADSINAAKQTSPQVILMPPPSLPVAPARP